MAGSNMPAQRVVDALLVLIDESSGKLQGSELPKLYQQNAKFRDAIESSGGPKKNCTKHNELEMVTQFGGSGWIQRRVLEVSAQEVVDALLALIDEHAGKFPNSQLPKLYQQNSQFRGVVERSGGLKKFCTEHDELEMVIELGGSGWMQRTVVEVSAQDVADALLDLIDEHSGKLPNSQLPKLYRQNVRFRSVIESSGGPKKFCLEHDELEMITVFAGCGWIQRRVLEVSVQDVVDALLALINEHAGKFPISQLSKLYKQNDKFRGIVESFGGPKRFCSEHSELEMVTKFGGFGWIQRRADELSTQDVVDALLLLIDEHDGKFPGNQTPQLYQQSEKIKAIVDAAGGLKKFCLGHFELEFVTVFEGPGWVERRSEEVSAQDAVNALLGLVDKHGGRFPGSQVPKLYEMNPLFKGVIEAAGGPKRFCMEHSELEFMTAIGGHGFVQRRAEKVSKQDVVDALLILSDEYEGRFPCNHLQELYEQNVQFKCVIERAGGLKQFCAEHGELEFVSARRAGGYIRRCAEEVLIECAKESRATRKALGMQNTVDPSLGAILQTGQPHLNGQLDGETFLGNEIKLSSLGLPLRPGQKPCAYYMETWKCKYGAGCKWNHPDFMALPPELNSMGFPMRPGQRLCSFYMKMSKCEYGTSCRWDHPEPEVEKIIAKNISHSGSASNSTLIVSEPSSICKSRPQKEQIHIQSKSAQMKPTPQARGFQALAESDSESDSDHGLALPDHIKHGIDDVLRLRPHCRDIAEPVAKLRYCFPMFDDQFIGECFLKADEELDHAVCLLSALLVEAAVEVQPADVEGQREERKRTGKPHTIIGHVIGRTDHARLPLFCFIVLVAQSDSQKHRVGTIIRPIPEDRFRIRLDESGHFWLKKHDVPEQGSIVEIKFFEEDTEDYMKSGHGRFPHRNEDLLCTKLQLRMKCDLSKHTIAREQLLKLVCNDIGEKWPWREGLKKFQSVNTDRYIWYVPAWKKKLPSVVLLKANPEREVSFAYRNATSNKMSINFTVGGRRLTDIPITAAGYHETPLTLNKKLSGTWAGEQLFVLGLARAERRGPAGCNRLNEREGKALTLLDSDNFEEYCQIMLIGTIDLGPSGTA